MAIRSRRNADELVAAALAAGQTVKAAAAAAGISHRTACRRWADPAFRQRVTELRNEMVSRAVGKLADSMGDAADFLRVVIERAEERTSDRVRAAVAILQEAIKTRDATELEERLSALERATRGINQPDRPPVETSTAGDDEGGSEGDDEGDDGEHQGTPSQT